MILPVPVCWLQPPHPRRGRGCPNETGDSGVKLDALNPISPRLLLVYQPVANVSLAPLYCQSMIGYGSQFQGSVLGNPRACR